ncbi:uncharacterized protein UV8b_02636 [Ustilaginoidea virens]|uniref:RRM domain-containing protein n=1 Tax=Ustilaginoidea virens TaxID=1159556 RepID=A0A8E5HMW0_USTVR|nr:uncharacterized protein UV8b_02636 [Ustilaginoidea virens]QUC18395.1 hypothetical protein UV8b_02636 [Ustilaginoidea virens]
MEPPFPTDVQEFDADDRISFSRLDNKFIAVQDDGTELEFHQELKRWLPHEHGDIEQQPHDSFPDQEPTVGARTRQHEADDGSERGDQLQPTRPSKKQKLAPQPKQNTAVYVTGLPLDATASEVYELFSRKAGVIAEEIDSGAPRIKLYTDESGNFKGDALVVFFKPQSVDMAIMLLDDTDFRTTSTGTREGRIRVQAADSTYKKTQYDKNGAAAPEDSNGGHEGEKRQRNNRDRQKIIKKTQKLDAKLADWDDDEPYPSIAQSTAKKNKTVILRHMFTLEELEEDPAALLEIKEDIRDECSKLGTVTSVVLYDEEPDGIVSVRFKETSSAMACIQLMHGRSFDGRVVEAFIKTGKEKYRKSNKDASNDADSD